MKAIMKKRIKIFIFYLSIGTLCHAQGFWTGDGGRGITIAVPPPVLQNAPSENAWIPQLFQDIITSDLAKFSSMTVLDRKNESLVLAIQQESMQGNYSDDNYIRIGHLTNAKFIVAGSINFINGRYQVNFRITNTETNEIVNNASFNKQFSIADIETGLAAKEAVKSLLAGIGITLTAAGERALLTVQQVEVQTQVQATANLAKGMISARSDNVVDALSYLYQASEAGVSRQEAITQINNLSFTVSTGSIRERANAGIAMQEKWKKIITDLNSYMLQNSALCLIYDFSKMEDKIDYNRRTVDFTINPGVQIVGNRTVILVWQKLYDEFQKVSGEEFMRAIGFPSLPRDTSGGFDGYTYLIKYSLYDELGDKIAENTIRFRLTLTNPYGRPPEVFSQARYYFQTNEDRQSRGGYQGTTNLTFYGVSLNIITDNVTPKLESVSVLRGYGNNASERYTPIDIPWYTPAEWQEWLRSQGNTR